MFKEPIDAVSINLSRRVSKLRQVFFEQEWYIVYDIIEFYANNIQGVEQIDFIVS
ncbi:MAG: hypothetical protein KGD58_09310 [Candidatus Lokiarchaeota archaeon]|nr:hypothetical protein [Candidatus Lokiarchaeota archaeon]